MSRRVLITRPEPGATRTAKKLRALGFEAVRLPLTEIRATTAELPGGAFDAVAVSSANALRHADRALLKKLAGLPVFAVGRRTAEAASDAGLPVPTIGPGDGEGLALLMARRLPRGSRIAYLCGRVRTPIFEQALIGAEMTISPVETYDTAALDYTDEELAAALGKEAFEAVLLYSRIAAEAFLKLTDRSVISPLLSRSVLVCMSKRVAEPMVSSGGDRVQIAATPDEEAMLALLAR